MPHDLGRKRGISEPAEPKLYVTSWSGNLHLIHIQA